MNVVLYYFSSRSMQLYLPCSFNAIYYPPPYWMNVAFLVNYLELRERCSFLQLIIKRCCRHTYATSVYPFLEPGLSYFIDKLIPDGTLKNQKYGHLDMLCETRWVEQHNAVSAFFSLCRPLVETLQHITEWKNSRATSKAEQIRVAVFQGSIVISLALSLTLPLSCTLQDFRLDLLQRCDKNGRLNQRNVFMRFWKQLKKLIFDLIPLPRNISKTLFSSSTTNFFNTAIMPCDYVSLYLNFWINILTTERRYSSVKLHVQKENGKTYLLKIVQPLRMIL
ncbi:hypothetical protein T11_8375 [Trichinella zimbabwensis]|uniref:Uncharacterized protein n=1 Tax=Trichinella zimbabwensis TaxID=268475 RepID=A0A0V1GRD5_9BILA|nr:hypothetical protein T11_8375 [Trichinella zimbabwensis]